MTVPIFPILILLFSITSGPTSCMSMLSHETKNFQPSSPQELEGSQSSKDYDEIHLARLGKRPVLKVGLELTSAAFRAASLTGRPAQLWHDVDARLQLYHSDYLGRLYCVCFMIIVNHAPKNY